MVNKAFMVKQRNEFELQQEQFKSEKDTLFNKGATETSFKIHNVPSMTTLDPNLKETIRRQHSKSW